MGSMCLFHSRLTGACVYFGVGDREHVSISESVEPGMRQFPAR